MRITKTTWHLKLLELITNMLPVRLVSPIPQVFTEVMTSLKIHMRKNTKSLVFQYIDDWLLIADTPQEVLADTIKFVKFLH